MPIQMHRKMVFMPQMRHLSLECRFEAYFLDFRMQILRQMQRHRQMHMKSGFYALNAAFISWMLLWSVIFRFQNANTKAKCKCKDKCIGKWFLCPKCGIYLLNAALKRDFSISEWQIQRQICLNANSNASENGFYALNAAFISWMPLWSVFSRFQNANTKANAKA